MADKKTTVSELKVDLAFYDGDNRVISIDNPRDNVTVSELLAFGAVAKSTQAVIGDRDSAACVGIRAAKKISKETTQLDLR